jgi:Immunoglobulin domain
MRVSASLRVRVVFGLLAATLSLLATSGCAGGWGALKPTIVSSTGTAGSSNQTQTVIAGQPATFTAAATGTGPFTYQWFVNGVAINGATSNSYTIAATVSSDNGAVYTVAVSNAAGTVMSPPYILTVNTPPVITTQPANQTVLAGQPATFAVTATGTAPFSYQWYQGGAAIAGAVSSSYTTPASVVASSGSDFTVTITNVAGTVASAGATLTVDVAPPLSFSPVAAQTYGNAPFAVNATSASSGAVTYSVVSGPATISGNTVTLTGTGTVVLSATQAASGNYTEATASTSFTVAPEVPTLSFTPVAPKSYGNAPFAVNATSASSGGVTYSVVSGPATVSGNMVTLTGTGTVELSATQAASGNYTATTTPATTSFTVGTEAPALSFTPVPAQTYGNAPFAVNATSASSGAVTYSVVSGPATISGNIVTLTGAGTVVLSATQAASGNYAATTTPATTSFTVAPTLTFTPVAPQTYGNAPFAVNATSLSSGAVTYSVVSGPATVSGNMVTLTGTGTVELSATQAASGNYAATTTPATTSFTVAPEVPTLSFASIGTQNYGSTAPFPVSATSASSGAVTYAVVSGPATISGSQVTLTGAGTVVLSASQAASANGNYAAAATVTTSFTVTAVAPSITGQPISQNLCPGSPLTLSVTANNATGYQWYLGAVLIPGATSSSYMIPSAISGDAGNYTVAVTNGSGSVTSNPATVVVGSTITTQPVSLSVYAYQTATFSVAATGISPFTYQWYQDVAGTTTAIAGATSSVYTTGSLSTGQSGNQYYATVTDSCPSSTPLTSSSATLTVSAGTGTPPTVTTQPVGQTVAAGDTAIFTAVATGTQPLSYQWYRIPGGGTNPEIAGSTPAAAVLVTNATSASYTVPAADTATTNDQDQYYVEVTNSYGLAVSQSATLAVGNGVQLQITGQPTTVYVNPGASATFSVTATSNLPLSYQWYMVPAGQSAVNDTITTTSGTTTTKGKVAVIPGATSSTYTVPSTASADSGNVYYAVVSNGTTSSVYSSTASLFVGSLANIPSCSSGWNTIGSTTAFDTTTCSYQLTSAATTEHGEIVWPTLISTGNIQLSFTIATSNPSSPPADGFAMVLGDPSLGATLTSLGATGQGLGAEGIPGFVLAFDDFYNAPSATPYFPGDPSSSGNPDYLGVGRSETYLWENPYRNVNNNLPGGANALAEVGLTVSHNYVVTIVQGQMTVTMDGIQVFSGSISVSVPPVAYLYVTSSTGGSYEQTVISNIQATVSAPSN